MTPIRELGVGSVPTVEAARRPSEVPRTKRRLSDSGGARRLSVAMSTLEAYQANNSTSIQNSVKINGLSIQKQHAVVCRDTKVNAQGDEESVVWIGVLSPRAPVCVNGKLVQWRPDTNVIAGCGTVGTRVELKDGDRVVLGTTHFYQFHNPLQQQEGSFFFVQQKASHQQMVHELANGRMESEEERERRLASMIMRVWRWPILQSRFEAELIAGLRYVAEANEIAVQMEQGVRFELKMVVSRELTRTADQGSAGMAGMAGRGVSELQGVQGGHSTDEDTFKGCQVYLDTWTRVARVTALLTPSCLIGRERKEVSQEEESSLINLER